MSKIKEEKYEKLKNERDNNIKKYLEIIKNSNQEVEL